MDHSANLTFFREVGSSGTSQGIDISEIKTLSREMLKYSVCRVCAKYYATTSSLVRLFEPRGESPNDGSLADIINKFLPIKVVENDELPEVVCTACAGKLMEWQVMVQKATQSAQILQVESDLLSHSTTLPINYKSASSSPSPLGGDESPRDSDSAPLAGLVARDPLLALRRALRDLRDHFLLRHRKRAAAPAGENERDSDSEPGPDLDPERVDDLTRDNMRARAAPGPRVLVAGRVMYECGECGRRVSSPHALANHLRIHSGARPCVCHVCGKRFRAPQGLLRHVHETHERRGRRACRLCRNTFANEQNLRQHMRTHTGERPHECALCGKRFAQAGSLHAHRRTHSERRAFPCADCGAAFKARAALARHALRHVRPHRCECGRAFAQRCELRAHAALHGDAAPYACATCGAAYKLRRALLDHLRRAHSATLTRASAFPGTAV